MAPFLKIGIIFFSFCIFLGRVHRRVDGEEDQMEDDDQDGVEAECCSHRCIAFCCDEKCVTFCCEDGISDTDENAR